MINTTQDKVIDPNEIIFACKIVSKLEKFNVETELKITL